MNDEMYWAICEACRESKMSYPTKAFAEVIYKAINSHLEAMDWRESCEQQKRDEGIWEDNGCHWPAN